MNQSIDIRRWRVILLVVEGHRHKESVHIRSQEVGPHYVLESKISELLSGHKLEVLVDRGSLLLLKLFGDGVQERAPTRSMAKLRDKIRTDTDERTLTLWVRYHQIQAYRSFSKAMKIMPELLI